MRRWQPEKIDALFRHPLFARERQHLATLAAEGRALNPSLVVVAFDLHGLRAGHGHRDPLA